mmetsp:Transcript_25332/g.57624  ORF Transcript_25332/g.57624 Transcript_25332/m.57624 type:complete len:503 (+) Transcript_25332:106-1614(+)
MAAPGINVIIPLGGLGTRFQKEGYHNRPKPFVNVLGKPMLLWVMDNLTLGPEDSLVVVFNPEFMSLGNFMKEVVGVQYPKCKFVELPRPTRGAAETVLFGLKALDDEAQKRPAMLIDGDTFYTVDIVKQFREVASTHNAVFCFNDTQESPIYSYIKLNDDDDTISEVKEKVKISDWANSGCYCFREGTQLASECEALIESNSKQQSQDGVGEFYTSGVIAAMIEKSEPFKALKLEVSDIHVLGTPSQVQEFCENWPTQHRKRFVFDLEGVLVTDGTNDPIQRNIEVCKRLKKQGHIIIVQTLREPSKWGRTWEFLAEIGVPADDLRMGRPKGEIYISGPDTVDGTLGDLDKQTGFYPTSHRVLIKKSLGGQQDRRVQKVPVQKAKMTPVKDLVPQQRGVNCLVKVLAPVTSVQQGRFTSTHFHEATCGDQTGKIVVSLTEEQKEGLTEGKVFMIRNGMIRMIKGFMRLTVDKWGRIDLDQTEDIPEIGDVDMSSTEYELAWS